MPLGSEASEARLSGILDALPDCVKIFTADAKLIYINPQGLSLLQAESLEELNIAPFSHVPAEYFQLRSEIHRRVIAGERVNKTYELIGLKGRRIHVEANSVPRMRRPH